MGALKDARRMTAEGKAGTSRFAPFKKAVGVSFPKFIGLETREKLRTLANRMTMFKEGIRTVVVSGEDIRNDPRFAEYHEDVYQTRYPAEVLEPKKVTIEGAEQMAREGFPNYFLFALKRENPSILRRIRDVLSRGQREERVIGGVATITLPEAKSALHGYVTVAPGESGKGIGTFMLNKMDKFLIKNEGTRTLFAEVESPDFKYEAEKGMRHDDLVEKYGDPVKRAKFFNERGYRMADVDIVQPSLGTVAEDAPLTWRIRRVGADKYRSDMDMTEAKGILKEYYDQYKVSLGMDDDAYNHYMTSVVDKVRSQVTLEEPAPVFKKRKFAASFPSAPRARGAPA